MSCILAVFSNAPQIRGVKVKWGKWCRRRWLLCCVKP